MAIDTLTQLNTLITNGSGAERTAFKNIIVNGLNAQDLADIITSSTREQKEAMAVLVVQAEDFLNETNGIAAAAQRVIDLATAQTWYDNNVANTLTWSDAQTGIVQLVNSIADRATLKASTETDQFRILIIGQNIQTITQRIRTIKAGL